MKPLFSETDLAHSQEQFYNGLASLPTPSQKVESKTQMPIDTDPNSLYNRTREGFLFGPLIKIARKKANSCPLNTPSNLNQVGRRFFH
jgi:hypothetical protein